MFITHNRHAVVNTVTVLVCCYVVPRVYMNRCWLIANKNIARHTAHSTVSWSNHQQWLIIHTSNLFMVIRSSTHILILTSQERRGSWKHTVPQTTWKISERIDLILDPHSEECTWAVYMFNALMISLGIQLHEVAKGIISMSEKNVFKFLKMKIRFVRSLNVYRWIIIVIN